MSSRDAQSVGTINSASNVKADEMFPVITFCGSMRSYSRMLKKAAEYTERGFICILPHRVISPNKQDGSPLKEMLDRMHRQKILMAKSVLVVGPFMGPSTIAEVLFAQQNDIPVVYEL